MGEIPEGVREFWRQYEAQAPAGTGVGGPATAGGPDPGQPAPGEAPWDIGHISAVPARGRKGFRLLSGHGVVKLEGFGGQGYTGEKDCGRDIVTIWSRKSRARLLQQVSAIDWDSLRVVQIVLTWGQRAPVNGLEAHKQVEAFWYSWQRKWGFRPKLVWKKEFQKRGVIHYTMYAVLPAWMDFGELNRWVHVRWYEIAGYGDENHLWRGADCREYVGSPVAYLMKECFAQGKEYQNIPPPGFHTGRWWGFIGGLRPIWDEQELSFEQGVKVRRLMRGYLRSKGYRSKVRSSIHGVWAAMLPATRARILEWVLG